MPVYLHKYMYMVPIYLPTHIPSNLYVQSF